MNGVSNTFASALWALNMLFGMARLGVDGVNVHTWRGSAGKLFEFSDTPAGWTAVVRPEYYGLLMFADAAPPGSRLLSTQTTKGSILDAWALRAPDGSTRVVLINPNTIHTQHVAVSIGASQVDATLQMLSAPGAAATSGVTLDCQNFGSATTTGVIAGTPCPKTIHHTHGGYAVTLPPASAALVTVPPPGLSAGRSSSGARLTRRGRRHRLDSLGLSTTSRLSRDRATCRKLPSIHPSRWPIPLVGRCVC